MSDKPRWSVEHKAAQVLRERLESRMDEIRATITEQIEHAAAYGIEQLDRAQRGTLEGLGARIPNNLLEFIANGGQVVSVEVERKGNLDSRIIHVDIDTEGRLRRQSFFMGEVMHWRVTVLVEPIMPGDVADAVK